ncbi:UNVERIFIED_CONTAM: hypothetical protein H355_002904 [Colinus virginianus]|nr:hypothetical protein H355_002904 [Colinus virginianus]
MHRLRHYLPPALAPAGQSLTKIETLRLATRYIAHLSALLGLSEEIGSPLDLDVLISSDAHGSPVLPGCSPARCWGWWS